MLARALTLSALVSFAASQLALSDSCQQALTTIATSPGANECLVPTPLLPILSNPNASIVDPVDQWLTQVCAAPACSNATLASIVSGVTSGCSAELQALGVSSSDNGPVTSLVQRFYPTVRKAVCYKDGNTNCVTQTLTNAQNVFGTLSVTNIVKLVLTGEDTSLPANVSCTNCLKAIYNTVNTDVPGLFNSETAQDQCGASFIDGATPAGISESASNVTQSNDTTTTTKNGSGATQLSFGALCGASIAAVFALFM
ncbi:hypothetical protein C0992_009568 [Termitomyces sp. T32_za158]|nr:hypothetical protein C0992_009568 [Termitomyces sp. T32_za158]